MPTPMLTRDILLASLAGFQLDKQRIDAKIAEVQAMLDGGSSGKTPPLSEEKPKKGRRTRSAAVRKRMADGQKARWAKIKAESEPSSPPTPEAPKAKRQISEEGMKRIVAATKKRWRLQRAAAKSAPAKKAVKKAVKKPVAEAAI